jgi:glycine betaine/choline ABC-type transport system substrate-binding protein
MDLTLIYRALADRQVDLIAGDATAGLIEALGLTALDDDRHYFPPYDAVPLIRAATVLKHPEVGQALRRLAGRLDATAMRRMNYAVDGKHLDPSQVVREFLDSVIKPG